MTPYLIIGDGRLATHISRYFSLIGVPYQTWSRNSSQTSKSLSQLSSDAERILLLISDDQIHPFVEGHPFLKKKMLIHCSGSRRFDFAHSAHPLTTFGKEPYELSRYQKIPFVLEKTGPVFTELLPGLKNPHFYLAPEKRALYHALCVFSGNFTTILWQKAMEVFEQELHLPKEILHVYLEQIVENLETNPKTALTGPLARGDRETLIHNLDALRSRPEQKLYYAFLNFLLEKNKENGDHQNEYLGI